MDLKYSYQYFRLTDEQVNQLKNSDDADSLCQLGCWYVFTVPTDDYVDRAADCFRKAIEEGSVEAKLHLANMYRLGDFGYVDMKEYKRLRNEAMSAGYQPAAMRYCSDIAYGVGFVPNLDAAIAEVQKWMVRFDNPDPRWFDLLGWMYYTKEDGDSFEKSNRLFQKAIEKGYIDSYIGLEDVPDSYEKGRAAGCADCCLLIAYDLEKRYLDLFSDTAKAVEDFSNDDDKRAFLKANADDRAGLEKEITALFDEAVKMGSVAVYYELGCMYREGKFGHKVNNKKAWDNFKRGSELGSPLCFTMMSLMAEEGSAPNDCGKDDARLLRLKALRYGDEEQLSAVIKDYLNGDLEEYAEEIVQNYVPIYESLNDESPDETDEDDDDYEDDDGRWDAWA